MPDKTHALRSKGAKVMKLYELLSTRKVASNVPPVVASTSTLSSASLLEFDPVHEFNLRQKVVLAAVKSTTTNETPLGLSETSDMLIDLPEKDDQHKEQQSQENPGRIPNSCNVTFAQPKEFSIFADLCIIPDLTHVDKCTLINFCFKDDADYIRNQIVKF